MATAPHVACAAPAPFAFHAPFARLKWCTRTDDDGGAIFTPIHEAARLLGRSVEALQWVLRNGGDARAADSVVRRVRVRDLPANWKVDAKAQYRALVSSVALLHYIRTLRADRFPVADPAVRASVDALRTQRVTDLFADVRAEVRRALEPAGPLVLPAPAAPTAPPPEPPRGQPPHLLLLIVPSAVPCASAVFMPATRRKRKSGAE